MDDTNLPLDGADFDDGSFDDGSSQTPDASSFSEDGDATYSDPLVFEDATALPPATEAEDAEVIESELPEFVDGSSFIDAMDTTEEEAEWDVPAMAYSDSPVALAAHGGGGEPMLESAGMPAGFASASDGFQSASFASTAEGTLEFGPMSGLDENPTFAPPLDEPFVQGGDASDDDAPDFDTVVEAKEDDSDKKASKRGGKSRVKDGLMLGIHVTPKQVYGVLIRPTGDGYEPLRQFVRNRSDSGAFTDTDAASPDSIGMSDFGEAATPDLSGGDVAISFSGGAEIDFSHEFAGLGDLDGVAMDAVGAEPSTVHTQPIVFELKDILDECEKSGFGRPPLALAIGAPDVDYLELTVPPEKAAKKKSKKKSK